MDVIPAISGVHGVAGDASISTPRFVEEKLTHHHMVELHPSTTEKFDSEATITPSLQSATHSNLHPGGV